MNYARPLFILPVVLVGCTWCSQGYAATVSFFDSSQVATLTSQGTTWDTIRSNGYYFTYSRDKLFTGGTGQVIGRPLRVAWPTGVEAQAVTAGPSPSHAKITIERVDGDVFDINAFSAKLLANTAGAGASFEVVPFLNGQEMLPDPVVFDATGYYSQTFSFSTSPNPWGQSTTLLTGYDKYSISLYVDFAWTALTLIGAPIPTPPGDYDGNYVVDAADYVAWRKADALPADYDLWRANFGRAAGAGAAVEPDENSTIPEPRSVVIFLSLILTSFLSQRSAGLRRTNL